MPFEKNDLDEKTTLADAMKALGAIFDLSDLEFDFDKSKDEEDVSKDELMDEALESMENIAKLYGGLYESLIVEGFTENQAFRLVEIYAENVLKALN